MIKLITPILVFISSLLFTFQLSATTIVPFPNLGEMAKATESVVYVKAINNFEVVEGDMTRFKTQLQVLETVKGDLQPGDFFEIQHWHQFVGDLEREIWGDLELKEGENYFLFLDYNSNGYWQPKMLSYAAFQEVVENNEHILVPFGLGAEVQILNSGNGQPAEPLKTYNRSALISQLRAVVKGGEIWNKEEVETDYQIESFPSVQIRNVNPGHCTHVSDTPYARWPSMETTTLPIWYSVAGDPGCANYATQIGDAITDMSTQYGGIDITNSGTHAFVPSCAGEGAADGEFTTFVSGTLGSTRHLVIQFDDPCSEITDLAGCSGTLAIGGLYWFSSTHTNCGITWRNAAYGYVIVNNGVGACQCVGVSTDYQDMITHEMSHSLNVGHIAGSGTANMNPSCCVDIAALDIACLEYMYPDPALPVEVTYFDGRLTGESVQLNWQTASENSNDFFTIERSTDGFKFEKIGQMDGYGDSHQTQLYNFIDKNPSLGLNYYRLSQTDFDGKREVFEKIVAVEYIGKDQISILPNPVRGNQVQLIYQSKNESNLFIEIFNSAGQLIKQIEVEVTSSKNVIGIDLEKMNSGVYFVKTSQLGQSQSLRFVKMN